MLKSLINISAGIILFFLIFPFLAGMFGFDDDILSAVGMKESGGGGYVGFFPLALIAMFFGVPFLVFLTVLDKVVSFVRKNKSKSIPESIDKSEPVAPKAETSDVEQNKPLAIIGYIIPILFFIPMLSEKKSPFGMFHAKQQLNLLLSGFAVNILGAMLLWSNIVSSFASIILIVLATIGIINAAKGEMKQLPVIGGFQIIK